MAIVKNNEPHFFKYYDFKGALHSLTEKRIRLSSPKLFNDPFDIDFNIRPAFEADEVVELLKSNGAEIIKNEVISRWLSRQPEATRAEVKPLFERHYDQHMAENGHPDYFNGAKDEYRKIFDDVTANMNKEFYAQMDDQFIFSLTTCEKNLLMWSHYAKKHQGVVIKFRCDKARDNIFLASQEVKYYDEIPKFGTLDNLRKSLEGRATNEVIDYYNGIVFTKSSDWKYEKEWRICHSFKEAAGAMYAYSGISSSDIEEVILGCRMLPHEQEAMVNLLKQQYPLTKISKANKSVTKFAVEISLHSC